MYKIVRKKALNPTVTLMDIEAPAVAKKGGARSVHHSQNR